MPLTPQQQAVFTDIASGKSRKEIAFDMNISTKTIDKHIAASMAKLGVRGFVEATHYALAQGWIKNKFGGNKI